jgi:hypothetical protein
MILKNNHHDDQRNQTTKWLCTTHIREESEEKISRQHAMQGMFQIIIKNNLTLIQNFTKTTTLFERLNAASFILLWLFISTIKLQGFAPSIHVNTTYPIAKAIYPYKCTISSQTIFFFFLQPSSLNNFFRMYSHYFPPKCSSSLLL